MGHMSHIIEDGLTQPGFVALVADVHPGLTFEYSPMLASEGNALDHAVNASRDKPERETDLYAAKLASKVKKWNATNARGEVLPLTFENFRRLRPPLLYAVIAIVKGWVASDVPPQPSAEQLSDTERELNAIIDGVPPGEAVARDDAKN